MLWCNNDMCLDQILVMKQQEDTSYKCDDYLQLRKLSHSRDFSGEPPLHLQQAAFEECAQFLNMLSIDNSPTTRRHRRQISENSNNLEIPTLAEMDDFVIDCSARNTSPSSVFDMLSTSIPNIERKHKEQGVSLNPQEHLNNQSNVRHLVLWRTEMSKWCYRVVDAYYFSRNTAAIALSNLDRYICTIPQDKHISITRRDLVLMTITCLYIAIKVTEAKRKLSIFALEEMSKYAYTVESIRQMECEILSALDWKVNPPVAQSFVIPVLQLFNKRLLEASPYAHQSDHMNPHQQRCILIESSHLVEMSLTDCALVSKRPSSVAIAAILISYLQCQFDDKLQASTQTYCHEMRDLLNIDIDCDEVEFVYNRLMKFRR